MSSHHCGQTITEQPRLRVEHRVLVAPSGGEPGGRARRLENLLDDFYAEHGPAWELVNVYKVGTSDFVSDRQELLFVFQRRTYQAVTD
ncbi:MAG: hypothetical protein GC201_09760 [Alphaproteobacteria bacterium]|nr:hypothetical protein [Alphaproteobacteria bacterium]